MSEEIPIYPMPEALSHWQGRVPITAEDFARTSEHLRARAFTISKVEQLGAIRRVHSSLLKSLRDGESMGKWRDRMQGFFERRGYTGKNRYLLDTIYRNAIAGAISAGRWEQAQAGAEDRPYGMYNAIFDSRTRPSHAAQHGKIYSLDHSFWRTWWPPNGHRCRCSVITMSMADIEDGGYKIEDRGPTVQPEWPTNPGLTPLGAEISWGEYTPQLIDAFLISAQKLLSPDEVAQIEAEIERAA